MRISCHWLSTMTPVSPCAFEYCPDVGLFPGNDRSSQNIAILVQSLTTTSALDTPVHMRISHMHWHDFFKLFARSFRWVMVKLKGTPERDNRKPQSENRIIQIL